MQSYLKILNYSFLEDVDNIKQTASIVAQSILTIVNFVFNYNNLDDYLINNFKDYNCLLHIGCCCF